MSQTEKFKSRSFSLNVRGWVKRKTSAIRYIFPGLAILFFGMLAIHASIGLSEKRKSLQTHYDFLAAYGLPGQAPEGMVLHSIEELRRTARVLEAWVYWSVVIMGAVGFVLLLLNALKMYRLDSMNDERKAVLQLLEQRLAAMEACLEGIGIVDAGGHLSYMNRALMDLHGIKPHEVPLYIGKSWLNLYPRKGQDYVREHVLHTLKKNGYWRGRSPIVKLDGTIIPAELAITLLPDGGFIGTARDVTEQIKAEQERKNIQDQLYQAQKMEAIGRLAGGIAHDFNNILASMNGYAEFLLEDLDEGSMTHGYARNILQAGLQARSLVDGILAFSRRSDGETKIFDLREPLEESLSMLRASLPRSIEVRQKIGEDAAPVSGSATRISQMIMNLCVNAGDAMEEGKGVLHIRLIPAQDTEPPASFIQQIVPDPEMPPIIRLEDRRPGETCLMLGALVAGQAYMCLSIEDTGSGMSRATMEHAFEPFFTTKTVDKGTGLGLSMVHGVIVSHKAALMLLSRVGVGTRFDLYFPLAAGSPVNDSPIDEAELKSAAGRILLVEDQKDVREMIEAMLMRLGYTVESAATGLKALELLRQNEGAYDLVLADQNMPKMTGLELINRALFDFPALRFILLSGYSQERLEDFMKEQPAIKASLRKPVPQQVLGRVLAQVLSNPL